MVSDKSPPKKILNFYKCGKNLLTEKFKLINNDERGDFILLYVGLLYDRALFSREVITTKTDMKNKNNTSHHSRK
jgi:hypothetical protein